MKTTIIMGVRFSHERNGAVSIHGVEGDEMIIPYDAIAEFVELTIKEKAREHREDKVSFPLSYLLENVTGTWVNFCREAGIDDEELKDGRRPLSGTHPVTIGMLEKYGILS